MSYHFRVVLTVGLVVGVAALFLVPAAPEGQFGRKIEVEVRDMPRAILASEIPSDRRFVHQFLVTNTSLSPRECEVGKPSCGCVSLELDGKPVGSGDRVWIDGNSSVIFGLSVRLPITGESSVGVELRELFVDSVRDSRKVSSHVHLLQNQLQVVDDISVDPPRLNLPGSSLASAGRERIEVFPVTVISLARSGFSAIDCKLSDSLRPLVSIEVQESGRRYSEDEQLFRVSYRVLLRPSLVGEQSEPADTGQSSGSSAYFLTALSQADPDIRDTAEIRFVDANGLIAIPKVSFGEVSVGGVSNKSFIVRAPFGAEFSIGEIHSVPAGLASEFCAVVEMRGEGRYAVVSVAFSPNTVGQRAGTLVISASDFEPVEVAVHGYGLSKEFE